MGAISGLGMLMKITCRDTQYIVSFSIDRAGLRDSDKKYWHGLPFMEGEYYM